MKIQKFGGTSVGSPARILEVVECVRVDRKNCAGVVVSAFTGVTDQLLHLAQTAQQGDSSYRQDVEALTQRHHQAASELAPGDKALQEWVTGTIYELSEILQGVYLLRECSAKTLDFIASFGERLSAAIIARAFTNKGIEAEYVDAREMILADDAFGCAEVNFEASYPQIEQKLSRAKGLPIITGFIAGTADGRTVTLGRGGSDFTAAIVGAAIDVEEIEIWTDVDGIMTADPRLVATAIPIPSLTFEEAMELSHFGAKILYPPTVQPALRKGIPIRIRNTMNPTFSGSVISGDSQSGKPAVTGISTIPEVALLRIQGQGMQGVTGVAKRVFGALAGKNISVILITQASSEHTICLSVLPNKAEEARKAIEFEFEHELVRELIDPVVVEYDLSILSVVGEQMRHQPGLSGKCFQALGINGVNIVAIAQGSSELNISAVIPSKDRKKALNAVHDAFFLSDSRTAHVFLMGSGLIGSTLLKQVEANRQFLKRRYHLDVRITGIANTKFMAFDEAGLQITSILDVPETIREPSSLDGFVKRMINLNLPHCIFVDCTASEAVPEQYDNILNSNISIVTPNKRALGGTLEKYRRVKSVEARRGVRYLYETCVGAGLPIIGTLNDLVKSGDEILEVAAVLSGTLSFIFNNFTVNSSGFADVVRKAQELGYTEPDPRDDLSGLDVGRKLLILAREIGWDLEMKDVSIENLVPESCRSANSVEDFYQALTKEDDYFNSKLEEAGPQGKLIYLASVREGKAQTRLTIVGQDHPFYSLSGSDNVVAFTTTRYSARPLVVKGPGAGPDVTAAGVFADIIRIIQ